MRSMGRKDIFEFIESKELAEVSTKDGWVMFMEIKRIGMFAMNSAIIMRTVGYMPGGLNDRKDLFNIKYMCYKFVLEKILNDGTMSGDGVYEYEYRVSGGVACHNDVLRARAIDSADKKSLFGDMAIPSTGRNSHFLSASPFAQDSFGKCFERGFAFDSAGRMYLITHYENRN